MAVKAIPVNLRGVQLGQPKVFSDMQWDAMVKHFGKNLAWKKVLDQEVKPDPIKQPEHIKEVELIAPVSTIKAKSKKKYEK